MVPPNLARFASSRKKCHSYDHRYSSYMQLPPSDFIYIAIENGTFIVDLPIKNCDFHSYYYILGKL